MTRGRSRVLRLLHGRRDALLVTLIIGLFAFVSLYGMGEATPAEADRAVIIEEMASRELSLGDFLARAASPVYEGAVLAAHRVLDDTTAVSVAALRLPSFVASAVLFIGFYFLVCLDKNRPIARATIFLLLSTPLCHYHLMSGGPSAFGVLFAAWALAVCRTVFVQEGSRVRQLLRAALCGLLIALAGLSIGLGGVVIPLLSICLWALLRMREKGGRLLAPLAAIIGVALLLVTLAAVLPGDCLWLTNNVEGWSFRGLRAFLLLLLPWGAVPLTALLVRPVRVPLRSLEGLSLLVMGSSLLFTLSTGTSEEAPALLMTPFLCLLAGEAFRMLLYRRPQSLARLSLLLTLLGLALLAALILLWAGAGGTATLQAMAGAMGRHRALSLLLLVGPVVAALTMVYQTVRRSDIKRAYAGILMMVTALLATDIPFHALRLLQGL